MFFEALTALFKGAWSMLTEINYPGTELSIAMILVGAFVVGLSLKVFGKLIDISFSMISSTNNKASGLVKSKGLKKNGK